MSEATSQRCGNCGQAVLNTDDICWHCGWQLTTEELEQGKVAGRVVAESVPSPAIPFKGIAVYSGLTVAIMIGLLLVIRSLSRHPLLVSNPAAPLESGWVAMVDEKQHFAFSLPTNWSWEEKVNGEGVGAFDETIGRQLPIRSALSAYGESPAELRILLLAAAKKASDEDPAPAFALIARDVRVSLLKPDQAIRLLQEDSDNLQVLRATLTRDPNGTFQGAFLVELVSQGYRCEQKLINRGRSSFLIVACAQIVHYPMYSDILLAIVDSFESAPD